MNRMLVVRPHLTDQFDFASSQLGLLHQAGTLLKKGFGARFRGGCLVGEGSVGKALESLRLDLVGIACLTPGRKDAIEGAQRRTIWPRARRCSSAGHPTIMYANIPEHFPFIDALVLGGGEGQVPEARRGGWTWEPRTKFSKNVLPAWLGAGALGNILGSALLQTKIPLSLAFLLQRLWWARDQWWRDQVLRRQRQLGCERIVSSHGAVRRVPTGGPPRATLRQRREISLSQEVFP
jgi:hypothetical protein